TLIGAGIGAAVGGLAGNQVGKYMDQQEQDLRNAMAQSEAASIRRDQEVLRATFKSEVLFDFDSATLKPGAYPELERVATVLKKYPKTSILVEGHTDASGSEDYNQTLSEKRAQAVKKALIQKGIREVRVYAAGYGESQPISSDPAANRRVTIVIEPVTKG
ncbi:MAG: OmpA family protein, partial [Desulfohalobiaceae bacterium]|nr:OmpA family protein [Desulfohalobiaceae bacterium]